MEREPLGLALIRAAKLAALPAAAVDYDHCPQIAPWRWSGVYSYQVINDDLRPGFLSQLAAKSNVTRFAIAHGATRQSVPPVVPL
jgi:hypothetical protein